jgi:hypothetical protein
MPSAAQSRYEAYVAQSNPSTNKGAITLPLPQLHPHPHPLHPLHPLANTNSDQKLSTKHSETDSKRVSSTLDADADTDVDSTRTKNQFQLQNEEEEDKLDRIHSHRLSESSIAKGKMPELPLSSLSFLHSNPPSHPHSHPNGHGHAHGQGYGAGGAWSYLEEGEIPYMEFGVMEIVLDDQKKSGGVVLSGNENQLKGSGSSSSATATATG